MNRQIAIALAIALFGAAKTHAQGYFTFGNVGGGVNAPVTLLDGTLLDKNYVADFIYGTSAFDLSTGNTSLKTPITFSGSGYFLGGKQTINDQQGTVFIAVRVWRAADGASFAVASTTPGASGQYGYSSPVQITLGTGNAPVPPLIGLRPFSLGIILIPEPSMIALGVLGLPALAFRRRK